VRACHPRFLNGVVPKAGTHMWTAPVPQELFMV
jgi:hypothetical protein